MIWLLNVAEALERQMPPLSRFLRVSMRSARAMRLVAEEARGGNVSAELLLSVVGDGTKPGLRQMRTAWRQCLPETAVPPAWWCEYAAWAIERATDGERSPGPTQARDYLVGIRDAGTALKVALETAHDDLYAAPIPDGDGGAESPMLTPTQTSGIVTAIDDLVAAVLGG